MGHLRAEVAWIELSTDHRWVSDNEELKEQLP